jgi:hypothetical protein
LTCCKSPFLLDVVNVIGVFILVKHHQCHDCNRLSTSRLSECISRARFTSLSHG